MFCHTYARSVLFVGITLLLAEYAIRGGFYAREIVIHMAVLGILAMSLDIVAGFGRLVSLCHGALMGVCAYVYAVATVQLGMAPLPSAVLGIAAASVFGTLIGFITGRTNGIFFIMATLAFGQMAYTIVFRSRSLGGDDGLGGIPRFDLSMLGIAMDTSLHFALFALALVLVCYTSAVWVIRSAFGRTLIGIRENEERMQALGVNTVHHRALAMGFSATLAGIAGVLAAQHTQFISPELLIWTLSGEVLIIVILGGLGTLIGPFVGAIIFVLLKHYVSEFTPYWHAVIGLILIAVVMFAHRGLYSAAEQWVIRKMHGQTKA